MKTGTAGNGGAPVERYDVAVVGGGLAGLTLARHLLLDTDKTVLLLERRASLPPRRQKVGESTVQLAGYYLSKVLDLEEHLLRRHFMKNNLRFYWPTEGRENRSNEDYGQSFIRSISNVASYQLDRNAVEAELLRLNRADPRLTFRSGARDLRVELGEGEAPHELRFQVAGVERTVQADWLVDSTGRGKHLARRLDLRRDSSIRHGSFFWWVEGLVNVEKLTDRSRREVRLRRERAALGHLPGWLATNHFMTEGAWFWLIPLHGKTSLGLVYDPEVVPHDEVFSVDKATAWVCRRFPLLARDLPYRKVLDVGGFRDFAHDCAQTLSAERWAMTGEAGRFSDPLYSPGSDLIAIHNTLIVDAVRAASPEERAARCRQYEPLLRAVYSAYEPSYTLSYDALGDQETFSLKYVWELTVYFAFYVFPFLNDLFTERRFVPSFLKAFARLGPLNAGVQRLLSGYYQWKKQAAAAPGPPPRDPVFLDFTSFAPLARAEKTFYRVGVGVEEARRVLAEQTRSLEELARFVTARVASVVLGRPRLLTDHRFVAALDLGALDFDPAAWAALADACDGPAGDHAWSLDPAVLAAFPPPQASLAAPVPVLQDWEPPPLSLSPG